MRWKFNGVFYGSLEQAHEAQEAAKIEAAKVNVVMFGPYPPGSDVYFRSQAEYINAVIAGM